MRATDGRVILIAIIMGALLAGGSRADAQASRTWVSGVGDDANPCSRTAPCLTFAGAIAKTADGGEIDALDSSGFGAVTITKNITLDGRAALASVLASGTNGIVINAPGAAVILKNLTLDGVGAGLNGVRIQAAGDVRIEHCAIFRWTQRGVSDERRSGRLHVSNTTASNNGQTGIVLIPAALPSLVIASLEHVRLDSNGNSGFGMTGGGTVSITDSVAAGNTSHGFYADGAGGPSQLSITGSTASFGGNGVSVGTGATVLIDDVTVIGNTVGLYIVGGTLYTYGGNRIDANGSGNSGGTLIARR